MFQETGESVIHIKLLSAWQMSTSQAGSSVSRTGTTTVGRQRTSQVWNYFECKGKVCQVLKVGTCSSDSDISEICGHKIEGKFPTN